MTSDKVQVKEKACDRGLFCARIPRMKRLPILFPIVLLVVSGVAAQNPPDDAPLKDGPCLSGTNNSQEKPRREIFMIPPSVFPSGLESIMNTALVRSDGTVFTLDDYRGKVVLLHLWANWASLSRVEVPHLNEIQMKYKDFGLEIVAVNIGGINGSLEDQIAIAEFAKKSSVDYALVQEVSFGKMTEAIRKLTKSSGVPQTLLIDREGKLRGVSLGYGENTPRERKSSVDKLMCEK